ncbi:MAG: tripartite tricarboxylate transporter substrate binding protein [Gammaproteobacteria bacterium]|nr:tripartite tricarboxylate transporter substrate binding protein [Gammaproteobacteria bacterium]
MHRRTLLRSAAATALAAASRTALAQDRGSGVVMRIVVPYAAGGQTDMMARVLAPLLSRTLERNVIVENRPGAAALIGTRAVQTAAPDGNTLLFHNTGFAALPLLTRGANYDPVKDFTPVATVGNGPNFLIVNGSVPARTLPELIAYAKTQPEGIDSANAGLGSAGHLITQLFAKRAGIKIVHVPYKGSAETANALISGEVKMQLTSPTEVLTQQAKAGKVRFLAVSSRERTVLAPNLPTMAETLPGFVNDGWFGLIATGGSPAAHVKQTADAILKAMAEPEVRERFLQLYIDPKPMDSAQFAAAIQEATEFWKTVISELGIQPT